jgi:hypothetical protein
LTTRREMLQGLAVVGGGGLVSRLVPDVAYAATQDFNAMQPGSVPPGWVAVTPGGFNGGARKPGAYESDPYQSHGQVLTISADFLKPLKITPSADYRIVADPTAPSGGPVLEIVNPGTDAFLVKSDVSIRDGYVEVQAKNTPVAQHRLGRSPKTATVGLVWRYQNPKKFYWACLDQSDFRMWKMDGEPEHFEMAPIVRLPAEQWHKARVEFTGRKFRVLLDGEELYTACDGTIKEAGSVGVCCPGDTNTHFDNFKYGASAGSHWADFNAMPWGPPPAPWVCADTYDEARTYYPARKGMEWDIYMLRLPESGRRNVLRHSGMGVMPVCINSSVSLANGYLEAEVLALAGEHERHGGIVWRYQDEKNYYVSRVECVDARHPVYWYRVVDGKRSAVQRSRMHDVNLLGWNWIRVEFDGPKHTFYWNNQKVLSATDNTFTKPGAIGLWTKLDGYALFDAVNWGELPG